MRTPVLVILLLCAAIPPARAQGPTPSSAGPSHSPVLDIAARGPLRALDRFVADSTPRRIRPTHWKEGAVIGGVAGGLGLALLADGLCRSGDTGDCGSALTGGFLLGAVLGGLSGALIGGQFPKREAAEEGP